MTTFPREVNIADLPLSIDKQELQRERIVLLAVVLGVIGKAPFCGNEDLYETLTLSLSTILFDTVSFQDHSQKKAR